MSETPPSDNHESFRDEDLWSFLSDAEQGYHQQNQREKLTQACTDIYYSAAAQTDTPLIIPADERHYDDTFAQLTLSTAMEHSGVTDQDELTEEMLQQAEAAVFTAWSNEHTFSQLIIQAIVDQRYLSVSSDLPHDDRKKQLSALSIGIPVAPEKWLPIINTALYGEPLDPSDPDDFLLIETHAQEVLASPEAQQAAQLQSELQALLTTGDEVAETNDQTARLAAVEYLTTSTIAALSEPSDTASLDATVDHVIRQCQLVSVDTDSIKQVCRQFIDRFYDQ